jgi:hypothetical protein
MNRTFKFTRFRFGASLLFLALCLLLAALWVRSYTWCDSLIARLPSGNSASIESDAGEMRIGIIPLPLEWKLRSKEQHSRLSANMFSIRPGSVDEILPWGPMIVFPYWYLTFVSAGVAGLAAIRWNALWRISSRSDTDKPLRWRRLENAA